MSNYPFQYVVFTSLELFHKRQNENSFSETLYLHKVKDKSIENAQQVEF